MKKFLQAVAISLFSAVVCMAPVSGNTDAVCFANAKAAAKASAQTAPIKIKALILPKFEIGNMYGDFPGEAQFYYEGYFRDSQAFDVQGSRNGNKLYVNADGLALYVVGMGKLNAALSTASILNDRRFDFSQAYIISTGCAGTASGRSVMGDVFLVTETCDYDLSHNADIRNFADKNSNVTWFPLEESPGTEHYKLNAKLMAKVYKLVKDTPVATTPKTQAFMSKCFAGADWATRQPRVLQGTGVTADTYWKGSYCHNNAEAVCKYYKCSLPFYVSEMEDNAIAAALDRSGYLDRYIIIRDSVNLDVFMNGATPESLWGLDAKFIAETDNVETADIFSVAMKNNFMVGKQVIDAILSSKE